MLLDNGRVLAVGGHFALDAYKDFLPRVIGDPGLEDFIRRQIDVETEHVEEILKALRAGSPLKLVEKPESQ